MATILTQGVLVPRVSQDALRVNVHRLWMIPVADVTFFAVVGLVLAPVVAISPRLGRSLAWRLLVGLLILAPLLAVEGLYPLASLVLACGIALNVVPWFETRTARTGRFVRRTFPAMVVGMAALIGISY
ncbi:hypothetical protein ACYOEI_22700, partial [Singulisphaera rosea]